MNDRIFKALERAGITDPPTASLDHDQQFFALTGNTLIYQNGTQALHRVTLREISRIHSDHQGTLRVETSAGTAITASLLGFDPGRVQRFFQTVRDTTARAKQQPSSPLPVQSSAGLGSKSFGPSVTASPAVPLTPSVSAAPASSESAASTNPAPAEQGSAPSSPLLSATKSPAQTAAPLAGGPPIVFPEETPAAQAPADQPRGTGPRVVKIGMPQTDASQDSTIRIEATKPAVQKAPPASSSKLSSPQAQLAPVKASEAAPAPATPSSPGSGLLEQELSSAHLIRSARTVGSLSTTVRVLSVVLTLGALGMGYFLWQQGRSSQIPALWTVTMGIVTAVALNVLAEVLKLLSAMGQAQAAQIPGRTDSGQPGTDGP